MVAQSGELLTTSVYFGKVHLMSIKTVAIWKSREARQLAAALASISSEKTMQDFLRDVMTEKEIIEISARLQAAKMLSGGSTYAEVVAKTKLSSRTVARISDWLKNGLGGYSAALKFVDSHHEQHTSPAPLSR